MNGPIAWYHDRSIHQRRIDVLARHFADLIAPDATVLDVGCGDGKLAAEIIAQRPDVTIRGIDVLVRDSPAIPVTAFDGETIPMASQSIDTVTLVDVLHHTDWPQRLLCEVARVTRKQVIIKDHYLRGFAAGRTLALMDHIGNARHGVRIPCNYLPPARWVELYHGADLKPVQVREKLGLYPLPLNWFFERRLHFIAALEPRER